MTTLRRARMLAAATDAAATWEADPARVAALADLALAASEAGGLPSSRAVALARSAVAPLVAEGAFAEAAALLRRALDLSTGAPWRDRHGLVLELADCLRRADDLRGWAAAVEAALGLAVAAGDWEAGGRSLAGLLDGGTPWSWLSYGGVRTTSVELLAELLALVPSGPGPARRVTCLATAVLAAELYFSRDVQRCAELSRTALELARQIDDDPVLFATVVALGEMAVWAPDGAPGRVALRREALSRGLPR